MSRIAARSAELAAAAAETRREVSRAFFESEVERIATLCHRMAERFARGGRLLALGASPAACSDARHVAVEFVHPVIVGKRALPALGLTLEGGSLATQVELLASESDIAMAFEVAEPGTAAALAVARARGCLTIAFEPADADWVLEPPTDDPWIRQELAEVVYHLLWELVHLYFDHRGLLEGRTTAPVHDAGASSFLYPFLAESERDATPVHADVQRSIELKAAETSALAERTLLECAEPIWDAAVALRACFERGGTALVLGNGGSATDAMDLVADLREPPAGVPARAAIDLTADAAILTALANDIGTEVLFSRQVMAYGRPGDAVIALSTSGNSRSVLEALREARRRDLVTIAFVGYDGGEVLAQGLADHVIVTRSVHIPRIQEAQASAYHVLREWIERADAGPGPGPSPG